jgi:hypothetical protein
MKLLLIDDTVKYEPLINARQDNVDYIIFNAFEETYNSLLDKIAERNVVYTDIALVQHASQRLEFVILQKEAIASINDEHPYSSFNDFKQFLIGLKKLVGVERVDLLGCLLYRNIKIHDIVKYLEDETGLDLRASTNFTGNPDSTNTMINENGVEVNIGADWIMESDNVDIRKNYFTELIRDFKDILYIFMNDFPVNNKYSGAGADYSLSFIDSSKNVYYVGKGESINRLVFTTAPNTVYTAIDISAVIPNYQSYAVIDKTNNVWSWGSAFTGGNDSSIPTKLSISVGVSSIVSTNYSYSALDNSGNVWVWGNPSYGSLSLTPTKLKVDSAAGAFVSNITSLLGNGMATCGIGASGNVWVWGSSGSGGSNNNGYATQLRIDNATTGVILSNIVKVYCTQGYAGTSSFLHLDTSGNAYVNGNSSYGGNGVIYATPYVTKVSGVTGITTVVAIQDRYSVMDASGNVWLLSSTTSAPVTISSVQLTGITAIYTSYIAFYAISGSNVYTWTTTATATLMTGGPTSISKVVTNNEAIAIINNTGILWTSGASAKGGNGSTTAFTQAGVTGAINVYYIGNAFAVINAVGNVWIWGRQYEGGNGGDGLTQLRIDNSTTGTLISGIVSIVNAEKYHYAGRIRSFAALHSSGNVYVWGEGYTSNGATYASLLKDIYGNTITGITKLYCNYGSFIAETNGGFYSWGIPNFGALGLAAYKVPIITNARKIYSNLFSYTILDNNFNAWVLGPGSLGGSSSAIISPLQILSGIKIMYIYSINYGFLAVSESGRGYIWFDTTNITELTTITKPIIKVVNNYNSFAILDSSSNVWILGSNAQGGNGSTAIPTQLSITNITNIYSTQYAFAAVDISKNVWIWGASAQGGNGSNVASQLRIDNATTGALVTNIKTIYSTLNVSNNGAFAALDMSGFVYVWGGNGYGGNGQNYASLLTYTGGISVKNIKSIGVAGYSFAALDTSGFAWLFGSLQSGGSGSGFATKLRNVANTADLPNIVEIASTMNYLLYRDSANNVYTNVSSTSATQLPVSNINAMYTTSFGHLLTNTSNNVYTSAGAMGSEANNGSLLRYDTRLTGTPFISNKKIVSTSKFYFALTDTSDIIYVYGYDTQLLNIGFNTAVKPLNIENKNLYAAPIPALESNIYVSSPTIALNGSATIINNVDNGIEPYTYTWRDFCGNFITNNSLYTVNKNILTINNNGIVRSTTSLTYSAIVTDSSNTPVTALTLFLVTFTGVGNPLLSRLNASAITIPLNSSQQLGVSLANGIAPYTYKWFTNINNPLQTTTNSYSTTSYYTITNSSLFKNTTTVTYSALAYDTDPAINSQANYSITLIGYGTPVITQLYASSINVFPNEYQQIGISLSGGLSPYTYKWYNHTTGNLLLNEESFSLSSYITLLNNFNYSSDTTVSYRVDVSDSDPTTAVQSSYYTVTYVSKSMTVTITSAVGQTLPFDQSTVLTATADGGIAPYRYTWYSVGNPDVPLYNNELINISGNTLTITNNRQYRLPTSVCYKCIAHNA